MNHKLIFQVNTCECIKNVMLEANLKNIEYFYRNINFYRGCQYIVPWVPHGSFRYRIFLLNTSSNLNDYTILIYVAIVDTVGYVVHCTCNCSLYISSITNYGIHCICKYSFILFLQDTEDSY